MKNRVPMVKSDRGYIVQIPLKRLLLAKAAFECYRLELSKTLLRVRMLSPEASQEIRNEIYDLKNMIDSIEENVRILEKPLDRDENDAIVAL